ncbi:MAG TPA: AAA family ATPase [Rhizomicrobium sp.]|nr:AAA family ATPase [Rhizomicrobium sp.]
MNQPFLKHLRLDGFLSFEPGSAPMEFAPLNVLIGPNGSGKSNLIEAIELLHSTSTDLSSAIRDGGGAGEWLWKGSDIKAGAATIDVELGYCPIISRPLRYRLQFDALQGRAEVLEEDIEEVKPISGKTDVRFFYRFQGGNPYINVRGSEHARRLERASLAPGQSVLAQRKDPDLYPEITWLGQTYGAIQTFREWTFGRYAPLRQPQTADLPEGRLLPDSRNLALVLNQIEHGDGLRFNELLKRFFPRFQRMSTRVLGGTVQFYLHETGFSVPIPPTRLSDGTIRFVALLATLLAPEPPPLVCIEEPELGLHPDSMFLIADLLKEASSRMQIIVTTHSDALVSALSDDPQTVVTCERVGGATKLRRLDADRLSKWLENYRLGDLWRMGELGANP